MIIFPVPPKYTGNGFWLMCFLQPVTPSPVPDRTADNIPRTKTIFPKQRTTCRKQGDFFLSHPFIYAARKAASGTVEWWCFLCGPFYFYIRALLYRNIVLSSRMCLIWCGCHMGKGVSQDSRFSSLFHGLLPYLFLALYFPETLVTTINLCLWECFSVLPIPRIVGLIRTFYLLKYLSPPSFKSTASNWMAE